MYLLIYLLTYLQINSECLRRWHEAHQLVVLTSIRNAVVVGWVQGCVQISTSNWV